jgi:YesN/AraC family two-component response regulator
VNPENEYNLLIVDDDPNIRAGLKRLFRTMKSQKPQQILEASDGPGALACLRTARVDCILLDYNMPGGSGLTWLEKLHSEYPFTAMIMLTGCGSEQVAAEAMKSGAMDYLVKGMIAPEDLQHALINALQKVRMLRTIDQQRTELLEAERQRVMIESLAAACHHLGQPVTVLSGFLEIMNSEIRDGDVYEHLQQCRHAVKKIAEVIHKLQALHEYRTEPYLQCGPGGERTSRMLKI